MEIFAIGLSVPGSFAAGIVYSFIIGKVTSRWKILAPPLLWLSGAVLILFVIETAGVALAGVLRLRDAVGPSFYWIHLALFFFTLPSLVNVMRIQQSIPLLSKWYVIGPLCAVVGLFVVLLQYHVSETLFGAD